jgi:hypothetical protein
MVETPSAVLGSQALQVSPSLTLARFLSNSLPSSQPPLCLPLPPALLLLTEGVPCLTVEGFHVS